MNMLLPDNVLHLMRAIIGSIGVLVICLGALRSLYQLALFVLRDAFDLNYIRLQFGDSVILGLEFMVGADIIGSLVAPDYYNLGLLAIIVVIRTILSYFLTKELEELKTVQRTK
ncbi:MAG TPA: DUF1622 domain-containing protein [Candidatus Dependentiae bacterium]|nr:DUF1622 domain-containing protein [Candidatus Dependentiae bacterium]HRQ62374.1 DUF1622 domain-containing protein [Candidatus Dependentiae bacterium]